MYRNIGPLLITWWGNKHREQCHTGCVCSEPSWCSLHLRSLHPNYKEEYLDHKNHIKDIWTPKIHIKTSPVFDQPVVPSSFSAVAHSQHSMVHIVATCVVPVHTCGGNANILHRSKTSLNLCIISGIPHHDGRRQTWAWRHRLLPRWGRFSLQLPSMQTHPPLVRSRSSSS